MRARQSTAAGTGVLIASRFATDHGPPLGVPWPETAASARIETGAGPIELHAAHVPNAANGWVKPQTLRAIRAGLARPASVPRVLCGSPSTPMSC